MNHGHDLPVRSGIPLFPRTRQGCRLALLRLALALAVVAVLLFVMLGCLQQQLLHHPTRYDAAVLDPWLARGGLSLWPSRDAPRGLIHEPPPGRVQGTVAVFHGNAGSAADRDHYVAALAPLGYRVLLLEYPGYGFRQGSLDEQALYQDGVAALQQALAAWGRPLYVFGESLGAGVAAGVVARMPSAPDGLVLITPWDDLPTLAQSIYWFLPVRWLVRERYDSLAHLQGFAGPLTVVVATRDEVIPPACSERLFQSFPGPKRLVRVEGAGHNTWFDHTDLRWWAELMQSGAGASP